MALVTETLRAVSDFFSVSVQVILTETMEVMEVAMENDAGF